MPPEAGHGALIAITLDPVASPGVFTTVAHINSNLDINMTHEVSGNIAPHNDRVDSYVVSPVVTRDPLSWEVNYIHGDSTQDALRDFFLADPPTVIGLQFTGPSGASTDRYIMSGAIINWYITNPVRNGERRARIQFRPSGEFRVDGTLIS